jgi:hypothetical protein
MIEANEEAAAILRDAGWKPHDAWNVYTRDTLVMGFQPDGQGFHVKNWGADVHGPDCPDDAIGAALWLVAKFPGGKSETDANASAESGEESRADTGDADHGADDVRALHEEEGDDARSAGVALAPVSEPEETPEHDEHPAISVEAEGNLELGIPGAEESSGAESGGNDAEERDGGGMAEQPIDADFYESAPAIEGADLGAEILDEEQGQQAAYIFGDNLDQKRTAAIGLVVQIALSRMPAPIDYAQLSELRNFTMGVSEGRWPDDPAKRDTLEALEANERARRSVEAARDAKTAFLVTATREQIESFDPEQDWP